MKQRQILYVLLPALLLSACVPMVHKEMPIEASIINHELNASLAASTKTQSDLKIDWWKSYGDKQLNTLIEKALNEAPTIKSIQARYTQANNFVDAQSAANIPQISANGGYTRERFSENYIFPAPMGGGNYSLYQTGLTLDYTFDFWNARASKINSAKYTALAQKATIDATRVALASGLCAIYLAWNYDEQRVTLLEHSQEMIIQKREILERKFKEGLIDATAIYAKTEEISAISQKISALKRSIAGKKETLAIMGGFLPSYIKTLQKPKIEKNFEVPLPKEIYLNLVAHRADVTIEKYIVLSKSQKIENAKAQFYPNISLSGLLSFVSFDVSKFLSHSSYAPLGGTAVSLPLLDGGAREANLKSSVSDYNSSVQDYNGAIIKAANEIIGVLKRQAFLNSQIDFHKEEINAQKSGEELARKRYQGGLTNKLPYLHAKLQSHRGELGQIALDEKRAALQIELIKALGGGYLDTKENVNAKH